MRYHNIGKPHWKEPCHSSREKERKGVEGGRDGERVERGEGRRGRRAKGRGEREGRRKVPRN